MNSPPSSATTRLPPVSQSLAKGQGCGHNWHDRWSFFVRLTPSQVSIIRDAALEVAGSQARVWLYGSRLDDARRGGDVDLLVESTPPMGLRARAKLKWLIEQRLGLPVDVLAAAGDETPSSAFVALAKAQAQRL